MKITYAPQSSERGTTLIVALFLCMILSVTIAGYMHYASQQNHLSMRSQSWNLAIAVTEAGIEEALQQLNSNTGDLSADGWTASGSKYSVHRELNSRAAYTVWIDMTSPTKPRITSQSFIKNSNYVLGTPSLFATSGVEVNSPSVSRAVRVTTGRTGFFQKAMVAKDTIDFNGNNVMTDSFNSSMPGVHSTTNGRYPVGETSKLLNNGDVASNSSVQNAVNVGNANVYGRVAVGPNGTMYLGNNGGVGTRTYQAANPGKIQPGYFTDDMNFTFPKVELPYTSGLKPDSGTVYYTNYLIGWKTNSETSSVYPNPVPPGGVTTNVNYTTSSTKPSPIPYGLVTNVLTIYTSNNSFPNSGTYIGEPTKVKDGQNNSFWAYYLITGTNYTYPTFTYSYLSKEKQTNAVISSETYDYIIQGSAATATPLDYYVSDLPGGNILVKGNARLVIRNNLDVGGNKSDNKITLSTDARLEMWVGGTSCKISGNGVVNPTGYAQNFICWCTDSVTDVSLNGNGEFTGILIAPNAAVQLNGGGKAYEDFIGSVIARTIKLNGHFNFHYDEALKNYKNNGRYTIREWNEIPITQVNN